MDSREWCSVADASLLSPISNSQAVLLQTIVQPVVAPHLHGGHAGWPAWAYVVEQLEAVSSAIDPMEAFQNLPRIRGLPGGRNYGLVWRADNRTTDPTPDERVGLSIAGLYRLHELGRATGFADGLVAALASLAEAERALAPATVAGPGSVDVLLDDYVRPFPTPAVGRPYAVPTTTIAQLIQREFFPVMLLENQESWQVRLGNRWLQKFRHLTTAAEYLERVADASREAATTPESFPRYRPPVAETRRVVVVTDSGMTLEPGWNQPESDVRRLIFLDWIYDAGQAGARVNLAPLFEPAADAATQATVLSDLKELDARGWIDLDVTHDVESTDCAMTGQGVTFVEQIRIRRGDLSARRRVVRDAFLQWLYSETVQNRPVPNIEDFSLSNYSRFLGQHFTAEEVAAATRWLKENDLLAGTSVLGGGVPRPKITAKGELVAESGRSVNEVVGSAAPDVPFANVTIQGNNNVVQAASPGASAHVAVTVTEDHRRQLVELATTVEEALPALGSGAREVPAALRELAASGETEPGVVATVLQSTKVKLLSGAGEKLGSLILGTAAALFRHYGVPL